MFKNKAFNLINSILLGFTFSVLSYLPVYADNSTNLPDNVKITTNNDGSSTTVMIDSKPGYYTSVETTCVNGVCTHNTTSRKIDDKEIQDNLKKQQEYWNNFWKQQEEFFKAQQKIFQDLWNINF